MADGVLPDGSPSNSGTRKRFPKTIRLLRHADFERVYKQGKRHFAANLTVFYLARPEDAVSKAPNVRIGFTVGRGLGGAVQRNRMKRRLREAVRLCGLPAVPVDVVVNPKKTLLTMDFTDLQNQITRALQVVQKANAAPKL